MPQALRVRQTFAESEVAVVSLHAVFEHHAAQGSQQAFAAFLHDYRIEFPAGIDRQTPTGGLPETMATYAMYGTPTTLLIDRAGRLRLHKFGHIDDLRLGESIAALLESKFPRGAPRRVGRQP